MGVNQIALHLLENLEHHQKYQCLHRIYHKNEEGSHDTAHERAEYGNQSRKCDQHSDKQPVGQAENGQGHKEHCPARKLENVRSVKDVVLSTFTYTRSGR